MKIDEAISKLITLWIAQTLQANAFNEDGEPLEHDFQIAVNMAKEALEKRKPTKPIGDLHGVQHYRCPSCHGVVKVNDNRFPCCPYCGQVLDWSEEDD